MLEDAKPGVTLVELPPSHNENLSDRLDLDLHIVQEYEMTERPDLHFYVVKWQPLRGKQKPEWWLHKQKKEEGFGGRMLVPGLHKDSFLKGLQGLTPVSMMQMFRHKPSRGQIKDSIEQWGPRL